MRWPHMSPRMAIQRTNSAPCTATAMQHDVFINPAPRSRSAFPPIAVLQADIAEGRNRMIAPMAPRAAMPAAIGRLMPVVRHDGRDYLLAIELMVSIPPNDLRYAAGDMPSARSERIATV